VVYTTKFPLQGVAKWIVNDWEIAPLLHITSGAPINVTTGQDLSLTDTGNDRPNVVSGVNQKTGVKLEGGHAAASVATRAWLNLNAFCGSTSTANPCANPIASGTFGNLGRNAISGPMLFQNDAQISRLFPIRERVNIQTRLEAFNFLNHPSFSNPSSSGPQNATFGEISGTSINARIFQGSLKLIF
jgi:hypothetical protein